MVFIFLTELKHEKKMGKVEQSIESELLSSTPETICMSIFLFLLLGNHSLIIRIRIYVMYSEILFQNDIEEYERVLNFVD